MVSSLSLYLVVAALLAFSSFFLGYISVKTWRLKRRLIAYGSGSSACLVGLACIVVLFIASNLQSFHRLTYEEPIAELAVELSAPQVYLVRLFIDQQEPQNYELWGDEWQVDARILKWHSWVNLLGLHTQYRLERLSSRYHDPEQARRSPHSVITLGGHTGSSQPVLDWLPLVDTIYGNSTYMPLGHGARYRLLITTSGVIARPINNRAETLLQNWH